MEEGGRPHDTIAFQKHKLCHIFTIPTVYRGKQFIEAVRKVAQYLVTRRLKNVSLGPSNSVGYIYNFHVKESLLECLKGTVA